jgi:hypothetical protein
MYTFSGFSNSCRTVINLDIIGFNYLILGLLPVDVSPIG